MKKMLQYLVLGVALTMVLPAQARSYTTESLSYDIVYQWGVIWKHAADATLSIHKSGSGYQAQLTGKTRSWADKVYPVRDTLRCTMNAQMRPLRYEKVTHEKSYYARDLVVFTNFYGSTSAKCTRYRKKGNTSLSLQANCPAYDMVSVFYMLRNIDYGQWSKGKSYTTVVFSGKEKEYLTITYQGRQQVKLRDGTRHQAYHLKLKFTMKGGKESSDPMDVWMSADGRCIPLMLVGKLPVGEVKCYYTGK